MSSRPHHPTGPATGATDSTADPTVDPTGDPSTGPTAGGPHALLRYAVDRAVSVNIAAQGGDPALLNLNP